MKILVANYNKKNKKYLESISIVNDEKKAKLSIKKQLMQQILEEPQSIKAFKDLEIHKIGILKDNFEIENTKHEVFCNYEKVLEEIIETITKEIKKWKT